MQKLNFDKGFHIGDDNNLFTKPPLLVMQMKMINAIAIDQRKRLKLSKIAIGINDVPAVRLTLTTAMATKTAVQKMYPTRRSFDDILTLECIE